MLPEDRQLMDAFRRGEPAALVAVYRAYAPVVSRVLTSGFSFESQGRQCRFRGLRSAFDLEDRLQEVFARAFTERARLAYDGITPYRAYLIRIARNLVIDEFRAKKNALLDFFEETPEAAGPESSGVAEPLHGLAGVSGSPEADTETAQTLALIERFRASLGPREQKVLELRFRDGLEQAEIGTQIGLSPSRVKTSEQRIRRRFFRFMKQHGYFDGYEQDERGWIRALVGRRRTS